MGGAGTGRIAAIVVGKPRVPEDGRKHTFRKLQSSERQFKNVDDHLIDEKRVEMLNFEARKRLLERTIAAFVCDHRHSSAQRAGLLRQTLH